MHPELPMSTRTDLELNNNIIPYLKSSSSVLREAASITLHHSVAVEISVSTRISTSSGTTPRLTPATSSPSEPIAVSSSSASSVRLPTVGTFKCSLFRLQQIGQFGCTFQRIVSAIFPLLQQGVGLVTRNVEYATLHTTHKNYQ